jgi:pectate lyase
VQPQDGAEFLALVKLDAPWPSAPLTPHTATEAYAAVLAGAGATLPRRDAVDLRLIEEVRTGTATHEGPAYRAKYKLADTAPKTGIIDTPAHVGGWPELSSTEAPPDAWEIRFKLDPKNASDGPADADRDGYTNLEEYLNATDPTVAVDYRRHR